MTTEDTKEEEKQLKTEKNIELSGTGEIYIINKS